MMLIKIVKKKEKCKDIILQEYDPAYNKMYIYFEIIINN